MKKIKITLPMLAVFLGLVFTVGTAAMDKTKSASQDQSWTLEGTDPTLESSYQSFEGDIEDECPTQSTEVCGIKAPEGSPGQPDIDAVPGLADALENETAHPNIYSRP